MSIRSYTFLWLNRLFNLLTAICGLLLVAVIAIWVRSYFASDIIRYQPRIDYVLHAYDVGWGKGYIAIAAYRASHPAPSVVRRQSRPPFRLDGTGFVSVQSFYLLGVRVTSNVTFAMINTKVREVSLFLPCWLAALLSACLPAFRLMRWRARRLIRQRRERGHCVRCGYDLCATPDRCPECGMQAQPLPG